MASRHGALPDAAPRIHGEWVPTDQWAEVRDPYESQVVARTALSSEDTVRAAVTAARDAAPIMAAMPAYERAALLRRAADLVAERAEELASTITRQTGKVLRDSRREVARAPWTFRAAATAAETLAGNFHPAGAAPMGEGLTAFTHRVPLGVVGAITPFNAPLNLVAHKVAPALAAGNSIIVKPALNAPLSAVQLMLILEEAGIPSGALSIIPGGTDTGIALVRDPDVDALTFTGSVGAGLAIRQAAGLRPVLLELGGNSPNIVHHDADLAAAADACVRGGFANGGQSCNSVQRILVHADALDRFLPELIAQVDDLVVGDPMDPGTHIGPVIDEESADRVTGWIEDARAGGAQVLTGGTREGAVLAPTVVLGAPRTCPLVTEEIFAPVVVIDTYTTLDEAFAMANSTRFGLQAAAFTGSLDVAMRAGRELRAGGVMINRSSNFRLDHLPYGGMGESGIGREGPTAAVLELTEARLVVLAPNGGPI